MNGKINVKHGGLRQSDRIDLVDNACHAVMTDRENYDEKTSLLNPVNQDRRECLGESLLVELRLTAHASK